MTLPYDLDGKVFVAENNSDNGEVDASTLFHYHQQGTRIWATYQGGTVVTGHLLGLMRDDGSLHFAYHHINTDGEIRAGTCESRPTRLSDRRLQLHERWQWTTGDRSTGTSVLLEVFSPNPTESTKQRSEYE